MSKQPRIGDGGFQWNTAGWFGGQLGATGWQLLLGGLYCANALAVGLFVVFCALAANGVGLWLWSRRDRLTPFVAVQLLCGAAALAAAAGFIAVDLFGEIAALDPRYERLPRWIYAMLLIYPVIMGQFWLLERSARGRAPGAGEDRR